MRRLMAIDPAACSGVAIFGADGALETTFVVKPMGGKGRWYVGADVVPCHREAWDAAYGMASRFDGYPTVCIERGFGGMATAIRAQGMQIGYHKCFCEWLGVNPPIEVNVSEWRRVIAEEVGCSWPRDSDRCKALSVKLCSQLYGREVTADESDAALLGRAAIRMRLV